MTIAKPRPVSIQTRSSPIAGGTPDSSSSETSFVSYPGAPVMISKSHLFEGAPDVANTFVFRHLIHSDPDITAKNLRAYACISVAHRNEVCALFLQEEMREALFCSTRNALPSLLKDAKAAGQYKVGKQTIATLLKVAPCLYANMSWSVVGLGGRHGKLLRKILMHPDLKEVRLDMSGPSDLQIRATRMSEEARQAGRATEIEANALHRHVYKGLRQRKPSAPLRIDFIHRHTLNELPLARALEILRPYCKFGQDIVLRSIDLKDPVSKTSPIESGSFQLWNPTPAFLESITEWIASADSSISTVKLSGMRLGDARIMRIANALRESGNEMLREVDLSGDRIRKIGAAKLAEALAANSKIKILNLENNQIENTGASALYRTLQQNQSLEALHLGGNCISHDHPVWEDRRVSGRPAG